MKNLVYKNLLFDMIPSVILCILSHFLFFPLVFLLFKTFLPLPYSLSPWGGWYKSGNIYPCLNPVSIKSLGLSADAVHLVSEGNGPVREVVAGGPGDVADNADLC